MFIIILRNGASHDAQCNPMKRYPFWNIAFMFCVEFSDTRVALLPQRLEEDIIGY